MITKLQNLQQTFYRSIIWSGEALNRSFGQDISRCIWIRMSVAMFIRGSHFTISSDESIHIHTSYFLHIHLNIILSSILRCSKRIIPFRVSDWYITYLVSHQATSCPPTHLTLHGFMVVIIFGEDHTLWGFLFCRFFHSFIRSNQISV